MNQPLAWIDITAKDAARSRKFYGELFDWNIDVNESMNYGLVKPTAEHLPGASAKRATRTPTRPASSPTFQSPTSRRPSGELSGSAVRPWC